jgi:hypothetical protein
MMPTCLKCGSLAFPSGEVVLTSPAHVVGHLCERHIEDLLAFFGEEDRRPTLEEATHAAEYLASQRIEETREKAAGKIRTLVIPVRLEFRDEDKAAIRKLLGD